jgi:hypothetical protein
MVFSQFSDVIVIDVYAVARLVLRQFFFLQILRAIASFIMLSAEDRTFLSVTGSIGGVNFMYSCRQTMLQMEVGQCTVNFQSGLRIMWAILTRTQYQLGNIQPRFEYPSFRRDSTRRHNILHDCIKTEKQARLIACWLAAETDHSSIN